MIVGGFFCAGFSVKAMDHAGFKVRHEQLIVGFVEGDIAKACPGISAITQLYVSKHFRCVAGFSVQLVNSARPAVRPPHACHPVGIVCVAVQAKSGRSGEKNVWRFLFVKRNAENLPDLFGNQEFALRFIDPVLSLWRGAGIADIDDAADNAFLQNDDLAVLKINSGKPCGIGFTRLQKGFFFLGQCRTKADACQHSKQQELQGKAGAFRPESGGFQVLLPTHNDAPHCLRME
jgi:hypothetical protein